MSWPYKERRVTQAPVPPLEVLLELRGTPGMDAARFQQLFQLLLDKLNFLKDLQGLHEVQFLEWFSSRSLMQGFGCLKEGFLLLDPLEDFCCHDDRNIERQILRLNLRLEELDARGFRQVSHLEQQQGTDTPDLLILCCQLYTATQKQEAVPILDVARVMVRAVVKDVSTEKAARYLSSKCLHTILKLLEQMQSLFMDTHKEEATFLRKTQGILQDVLSSRTLQDHCVLSILEAVQGDARKVQGLSELPEPVKLLFHVPFQDDSS